MTRRLTSLVMFVAIASGWPSLARAGFDDVRGHATLGYAKLFVHDAQGGWTVWNRFSGPWRSPASGSFSATGGVDHPLWRDLRIGTDIGVHLLGSSNESRGSLFANVDYSVFEVALLAHWSPRGLGPVGRVSFGPALVSARAELSTGGGGAAFSDLAVEETAAGAVFDVTFMSKRLTPVRVGFEVGTLIGFLPTETWVIATGRLAFHY